MHYAFCKKTLWGIMLVLALLKKESKSLTSPGRYYLPVAESFTQGLLQTVQQNSHQWAQTGTISTRGRKEPCLSVISFWLLGKSATRKFRHKHQLLLFLHLFLALLSMAARGHYHLRKLLFCKSSIISRNGEA